MITFSLSVKIKWSKGKSQTFFFLKNQVLEPMRDLKQPIFIKSDKITKKSLDFYFSFHSRLQLCLYGFESRYPLFTLHCKVQMFTNILLGLLLCGVGLSLCYYATQLVGIFGRNARAERNLGGTRIMIILIGFFVVVFGVFVMFGMYKASNPVDSVGSWFVAR